MTQLSEELHKSKEELLLIKNELKNLQKLKQICSVIQDIKQRIELKKFSKLENNLEKLQNLLDQINKEIKNIENGYT